MKVSKKIVAVLLIVLIMTPTTVFAAEHQHEFTMSQDVSVSYSAKYCKTITTVITQSCKCGYILETTNTENMLHNWVFTCVDTANNGYQYRCSKCKRTSGSIVYPYSLECPELK